MTRQNVVITGANSGVGFYTALHFARGGAQVVMGCRCMEKAERARAAILADVPDATTVALQVDVSDLTSVHAFAQRFQAQVGVLDLLINNAGIVGMPLVRNTRGHEMQLATNYLGAFALTGLLLPCFRRDAPTRIVNVSSLAHRFGKIVPDDLNWETAPYDVWKAYANSKVAMMSHTMELNRRLVQRGSDTLALAAHPGFANTNIHVNSPALVPKNRAHKWFNDIVREWIPTAASAARSVIRAGTGEVRGGDYYGPRGLFEIAGKPGKARLNPVAKDPALGRRLWEVSESMTDVRYLSGL